MKSHLEKSIKFEVMNLGAPGGWLMNYQPGNATKYLIFFQEVQGPVAQALDLEYGGGTVVTFVNMANSPSILVPKTAGYLSLAYFMEKTGLPEGDAKVLVPALGRHLGLRTAPDEEDEEESRTHWQMD